MRTKRRAPELPWEPCERGLIEAGACAVGGATREQFTINVSIEQMFGKVKDHFEKDFAGATYDS